jgi:hypothetical protein
MPKYSLQSEHDANNVETLEATNVEDAFAEALALLGYYIVEDDEDEDEDEAEDIAYAKDCKNGLYAGETDIAN